MRKALVLETREKPRPMFLIINGSAVRLSNGFADVFPERVTFCEGDNGTLVLENNKRHSTFSTVTREKSHARIEKSGTLANTLKNLGFAEGVRHFVTKVNNEYVLTPTQE